ncbi:fasciclin domain-containing protein [Methanococcoides methylutens]|uniref:fasciclin domain-containing protein n=1 Tax=Methanococcoides methylutens TaxID=2226 RepID=UPI001E421FF9|nr:fasciclin domain-containing protein [Methanococcoides methylutens]
MLLAIAVMSSGCTTSEPEMEEMEETEHMDEMDEMEEMDIVDTAVNAGSFNTLVQAVQAAGLEETLRSEGPFTVFAPTDDAFAALPEGTLEELLADEEALAAVLTYHVVAGEVMAADVAGLESAETVQGESVTFDTTDGVMVNDANVIRADIMASNGVIHVIDKVILPPSMM